MWFTKSTLAAVVVHPLSLILQPKPLHMSQGPISNFIEKHYLHFNSAALVDAAKAYKKHIADGKKMMVTLAGAMSTGELGISFAEMIRQNKVQIISCTGANLEEDIFNLVAHDYYERVPGYRDLTPADEKALLDRHMNRVTDTCIPEMEAMRRIEDAVLAEWVRADQAGERCFPHEFMYKILRSGVLKDSYQIAAWYALAAMDHAGALPLQCGHQPPGLPVFRGHRRAVRLLPRPARRPARPHRCVEARVSIGPHPGNDGHLSELNILEECRTENHSAHPPQDHSSP